MLQKYLLLTCGGHKPSQDSALLSRSEYGEDKANERYKRPDMINTQTNDSGHEFRGERVGSLWMQRSGKSSWKRNKLIKLSVLGFEGRKDKRKEWEERKEKTWGEEIT